MDEFTNARKHNTHVPVPWPDDNFVWSTQSVQELVLVFDSALVVVVVVVVSLDEVLVAIVAEVVVVNVVVDAEAVLVD